MNNKRRKLLRDVIASLKKCVEMISNIMDEESDSLSNIPENLEGSDMYSALEDNVDALEDVIDQIEESIEALSEIG